MWRNPLAQAGPELAVGDVVLTFDPWADGYYYCISTARCLQVRTDFTPGTLDATYAQLIETLAQRARMEGRNGVVQLDLEVDPHAGRVVLGGMAVVLEPYGRKGDAPPAP